MIGGESQRVPRVVGFLGGGRGIACVSLGGWVIEVGFLVGHIEAAEWRFPFD